MTDHVALFASIGVVLAGGAVVATRLLNNRIRLSPAVTSVARRRAGLGVSQLTDAHLTVLERLGVTQTRTTILWEAADFPVDLDGDGVNDDVTYLNAFDATLHLCDGHGVEPCIVVHSPPAPTGSGHDLAWGIANGPAFFASLVTRWPGRVWQVMNEMDLGAIFNGDAFDWFGANNGALSQAQRGDLYGQFLGPVYDAMKSADPTCTVVAGGIAGEPTQFFAGLHTRAPGKYDAIAVHCYGAPNAMNGVFASKSVAMRAVLAGVPLWCTECGNNQATVQQQATDYGIALEYNDRNNAYTRVYFYQLDSGDGYELMGVDGSYHDAAMLLRDRTAP